MVDILQVLKKDVVVTEALLRVSYLNLNTKFARTRPDAHHCLNATYLYFRKVKSDSLWASCVNMRRNK